MSGLCGSTSVIHFNFNIFAEMKPMCIIVCPWSLCFFLAVDLMLIFANFYDYL